MLPEKARPRSGWAFLCALVLWITAPKEKVDSKIDPLAAAVASGFADVYLRFDDIDARFDRLEDRVDSIALDVVDVKTRLGRVEQRIDGLAVTVFGRA